MGGPGALTSMVGGRLGTQPLRRAARRRHAGDPASGAARQDRRCVLPCSPTERGPATLATTRTHAATEPPRAHLTPRRTRHARSRRPHRCGTGRIRRHLRVRTASPGRGVVTGPGPRHQAREAEEEAGARRGEGKRGGAAGGSRRRPPWLMRHSPIPPDAFSVVRRCRWGDGRWCGLNNEIGLLCRLGCYADFTFPSAPSETQPAMVNAIYYSRDDPRLIVIIF